MYNRISNFHDRFVDGSLRIRSFIADRGDTTQATPTAEFDRYLCSVVAPECDLLVDKRHSRRSRVSLVPSYVIAAHISPPTVWAGERKQI